MDRRGFLAATGLATVPPMLAGLNARAAGQSPKPLSNRIDFASDGLGLSPAEYAALLGQAASADDFTADDYSQGGAIEALEHRFADLLGKQAAIFLPTGTLANHLAVRKLAGNDRRVLVQADSHLFNDSGDCAETLSGLKLIPLPESEQTITLEQVDRWLQRSASGRVETKVGVISIESPVRRRSHQMVEFGELQRISAHARERGIRLHMDGARLFNLPFHSGKSIREHTALFDTVYVSLWKHFNGAAGAMLAGDADFIDGLFHTRRMFGAALPYAWPQVAVVAQFVDSYQDDYANSWERADRLIELLQADDRFSFHKVANGTSRFFMTISGVTPQALAARAAERGVVLSRGNPETGTFAMQVNPTLLRMPVDELAQTLIDAAGA